MVQELFGRATDTPQLVPGALRVYRCFRWDGFGLVSTGFDYSWPGKMEVASCRADDPDCKTVVRKWAKSHLPEYPCPAAGCTCGIYGWYRPDDSRIMPSLLFAAIEVSGRVLLGTHGVRAEKATVVGLSFHSDRLTMDPVEHYITSAYQQDHGNNLRAWAERWQVPLFGSRDELVEALPPEDLKALGISEPTELDAVSVMTTAVSGAIPSGGYWRIQYGGQTVATMQVRPRNPPQRRIPWWPLATSTNLGLVGWHLMVRSELSNVLSTFSSAVIGSWLTWRLIQKVATAMIES